MALPVFVPYETPSLGGFDESFSVDVREAKFTDGYKQRGRVGLIPVNQELTCVWEDIPKARYDEIRAFMVNQAGLPFLWAKPGETTQYQWTCDKWTYKATKPFNGTATFYFVQDRGNY